MLQKIRQGSKCQLYRAQYPPATFTSPPRWAPKQITTSADTTSSLQCPTLTFLVSGIYDHDGAFPPIYISPLWWQLRKQRIRSKFPLQPVRTPLTQQKSSDRPTNRGGKDRGTQLAFGQIFRFWPVVWGTFTSTRPCDRRLLLFRLPIGITTFLISRVSKASASLAASPLSWLVLE